MGAAPQPDAVLVEAARAGDPGAFPLLYERWLDRALELARWMLSGTDDVVAAAADGFEYAWRRIGDIDAPGFGPVVLRATRRSALGRQVGGAAGIGPLSKPHRRITREGATAEDRLAGSTTATAAVADEGIAALVRSAAGVLEPADRSLLDLHFRHGVSETDLATDTGEPIHVMEQRLFRLRTRFRLAVEALLLWQAGRPRCPDLAGALRQESLGRFDTATAAAVVDHAEGCARCRSAKHLQVAPAALLAALPTEHAEASARAAVTRTLAGRGVGVEAPMVAIPAPADAPAAEGLVDQGDAQEGPRFGRYRRGLLAGTAVAAVLVALVLLVWHPWQSPPSREVGLVGGASRGSTRASGALSSSTTTSTERTTPSSGEPEQAPGSVTTSTGGAQPSTSTTTAPTPSSSKAPAPQVVSLSGAATSAAPGQPNLCVSGTPAHLAWQTANASSVTVTGVSGVPPNLPASGSADVCAASLPAVVTLVAKGKGGQARQSVVIVAPTTDSTDSSNGVMAGPTTSSTTK